MSQHGPEQDISYFGSKEWFEEKNTLKDILGQIFEEVGISNVVLSYLLISGIHDQETGEAKVLVSFPSKYIQPDEVQKLLIDVDMPDVTPHTETSVVYYQKSEDYS